MAKKQQFDGKKGNNVTASLVGYRVIGGGKWCKLVCKARGEDGGDMWIDVLMPYDYNGDTPIYNAKNQAIGRAKTVTSRDGVTALAVYSTHCLDPQPFDDDDDKKTTTR